MSDMQRTLDSLDRTLRHLQWALAALNTAVVFLAATVTWQCARAGYPALAGGCAFLGLAALAALPYWWRKMR